MIYLDANVIIRLIEGSPAVRIPLEARLALTHGVARSLVTSRLALLECRSKPIRLGDAVALALHDNFFGGPELVLVEVDAAVIETATNLRAGYNFKTPDAIHLATAIAVNATAFLTGDRALARCTETSVEII